MIERLSINGFRNLTGVELEALGRFNLLVGPGNSGKTNLLEAIILFCSDGDPSLPYRALALRGIQSEVLTPKEDVEHIDFSWPPEQRDKKAWIKGAWSGTNRTVEYFRIPREGIIRPKTVDANMIPMNPKVASAELQKDEEQYGEPLAMYRLNTYINGDGLSGYLSVRPEGMMGKSGGNPTGPTIPVVVLQPFERAVSAKLARAWSEMQDAEQSRLTELLRTLDPSISGIRVAANPANRAVVQIDHATLGRLPVEFQGAGFVKAMSLGCLASQAKNGVLIADDFDACIHAGAQPEIIKFIMKAALTHNVQFFAATHSLETLDAFLEQSSTLKNSSATPHDIRILQLRRDAGKTKIKNLEFEKAQSLRDELGVDLRRTA